MSTAFSTVKCDGSYDFQMKLLLGGRLEGATVASFYTQKVATLCFGDCMYEARQDNLHPVIVA